jgi:hypothetical protein
MKKTIITLAALLALTTFSWADNGDFSANIKRFEAMGNSLADRAAQGEFKDLNQVSDIIVSKAQEASGGFVPFRNYYIQTATNAFKTHYSEITRKAGAAEDNQRRRRSDDQAPVLKSEPFVGEPAEIIKINPIVQRDPFYGYFYVENRKGVVEYSAAFNEKNDQVIENTKQQFIQKLEKAGWQYLDGDRMRWKGP